MNDNMERLLFPRNRDALFIFWYCGVIGFLVDLDHTWNLLGLEEPINLTFFVGRCLHTTLVFILYAVITGSIAYAYANRQKLFRWRVGVSERRTNGNVSPVCWDNYSFNCDKCKFKWTCSKEVYERRVK